MPTLTLWLPGLPAHQPRHRTFRVGAHLRQVDPAASAKTTLGNAILAACQAQGWPLRHQGPMWAAVTAVYGKPKSAPKRMLGAPKPTKPDVDNIAKFYLDAAAGIVFGDDGQIARLTVEKRYAVEGEPEGIYVSFGVQERGPEAGVRVEIESR